MTFSKYEFRRNFAVIIGIDEYQHSDIPNLKTAVSDAEKLAEILEARHEKLKEKYQEQNKYEVRLLKNATKHELDELLKDFKAGKIFHDQIEKINKNDRLLFYFAGHGIAKDALENQEGPVGYFFPKDAENGKVETYLPMQELHDALKELECRHMLAILDCCFAGAFQWVRRDVKSPVKVYKERYDRFIQDPAWQVITSAAYDQEALDSPGRRGKVQYEEKLHSPFAKALFDALSGESNQQNADADKDGIITANELYWYLRNKVENNTDENFKRQTPGYCPLRKHDKGEFIFLLPDFDRDNLDDAPPLNLENNPYRGLYSYEYNKRDSELFFGRETLIQELYQKIVLNLEKMKVAQQVVKNTQSSQPGNSKTSTVVQQGGENGQSSPDSIGKGLTVVLGASGTGKSSLVKAGLLPRLETQGQFTIITPMRPGENPVKSLAQVFLPIINEDAAKELEISQKLKEDKHALKDIINSQGSSNIELLQAVEQLNLTEQQKKDLQIYCNNTTKPNEKLKIEKWIENYGKREGLSKQIEKPLTDLIKELSTNDVKTLIKKIEDWSQKIENYGKKLLLIVDQWEELITFIQGDKDKDKEQKQFQLLLEEAVKNGSNIFHVIMTLRLDFESQFNNSEFYTLWQDENVRFNIKQITQDELREVIEKPASEKVIFFTPPNLVDRLINEVVQMPGALPLLSFTLNELYLKYIQKRTDNREITEEDYKAVGGVVGSLTNSANKIYDNLVKQNSAYEKTIRKIMLRMVAVGGNELARRRAFSSEFEYPNAKENERAKQVLDKFSEARLLVRGTNSDGKSYVEPAHDYLVTGWDKLLRWKNQELETLILQQRLTPAVGDWQDVQNNENEKLNILLKQLLRAEFYTGNIIQSINRKGQRKKKLHHKTFIPNIYAMAAILCLPISTRVCLTLLDLKSNTDDKTKTSTSKSGEFLWHNDPRLPQLSEKLDTEDSWLSKTEDRFVRHSLVKKGRDALWIGIIIKITILSIIGAAIWALWGQRQAQIGQIRALRKSAEAELSLNNDLEATLNVLRAKKGLKELLPFGWFPDPVEETELQATLHKVYYDVKERNRIPVNRGRVYDIALSPDGKNLATVGLKDNVTLWDTSNGNVIKQFKTKQTDVLAVAFHPNDSNIIATAGIGGQVKLWKIEHHNNNSVDPWKTDDGKQERDQKLKRHDTVYSIAFINNDKIATLEASSKDNFRKVKIWDILSGKTDSELSINSQSNTSRTNPQRLPQVRNVLARLSRRVISFTSKHGNLLALAGGDNQVSFCLISFSENKAQLCKEQQLKDNTSDTDTTIYSVAFDPDGKLAVAGEDGKVKQWEIEKKDNNFSLKTKLKEIPAEQDILYNVALSKDFIATRGLNFKVVLRDRYGKEIRPIESPEQIFHNNSVALSPDGSLLATAGEDGYVRLWDSSGKLKKLVLTTHKNVRSVTFSPDPTQKLLLTGGDDKTVSLWDTSGNKLDETGVQSSKIISVVFNPNNSKEFATFGEDGIYKIWEIYYNKESKTLKIQEQLLPNTYTQLNKFKSAVFTPGGQTVLTLGEDGKIKNWKNTQQSVDLLPKFKSIINSFTLTPKGKELVIGDEDGTVWRWNGNEDPVRVLQTHQGRIDALALTPNDKLVTVGEDGTLRIWDISNQQIQLPPVQKGDVSSVAFSFDSTKLATVEDGQVNLWDTSGNLLKHISVTPGIARSVAFSPDDNNLFVVGEKGGVVKLFDTVGNLLAPLTRLQGGDITSLSWSSDGKLLATFEDAQQTKTFWQGRIIKGDTGNSNALKIQFNKSPERVQSTALSHNGTLAIRDSDQEDTIKIFKDWDTKDTNNSFQTQQGKVSNLALSYDGKLLATTGVDGSLRLWDSSGKLFDQVVPHQGEDTSVVFSPNGKMLATIGSKIEENNKTHKTVDLWQITEGENKLRLFKTLEDVSKVAFSPNSELMVTGKSEANHMVEIWKLGTADELLAGICRSVESYLDDASSPDDRHLCDGITPLVAQVAISMGEKILTPNTNVKQKQTEVEAFANGDFKKAIEDLEAYRKQNPNDPEALIYLNNAKIGSLPSYTIGVSVPMSSNVDAALEILRGVAQSQNTINESGGINGKKLQVLIADDKNDPELAKQIADKFSNNPSVLGVLGHYASDTTLPANEIYNKEKLPAISPVSTSIKLSDFGRYTFRTVPSDKQAAQALAEYMRNKYPQSKAIVFYNSKSEYSNSLSNEFVNDIGSQISTNKIDLSDANFDGAKSIKEASPGTVLVLMPNVEKLDNALQVVKANAQRQQRLPMLAGDDVYSAKTLKEGHENAEGMVVAVPWHIGLHRNEPFVESSINLWGNRDVNWRTAMSYDATQALIAAIKQNPTREGVAQALRSIKLHTGNSATGEVSFSSSGDSQ